MKININICIIQRLNEKMTISVKNISKKGYFLQLEFKIDPKLEYGDIFGPDAYEDPRNKKHASCFTKFANSLQGMKRNALSKLDVALKIQNNKVDSRQKRSPAIPIALAVASMVATGGIGVYFGVSMEELRSKLTEIDNKLSSEVEFSNSIAKNTRLLEHNGQVVALKTNVISTSFVQFRRFVTCNLFNIQSSIERVRLYSTLEIMVSDVLAGRLSTHVVPLSLLQQILKDTEWLRDTLLENNPILLYHEALVTLVSVDLDNLSIRILLTFPRIPKKPEYVELNVVAPKLVVETDGVYKTMQVVAPQGLFLPKAVFDEATSFPLQNEAVFDMVRRIIGCNILDGKKVCEAVVPADERDILCLKAIVKGIASDGNCHVMTEVTKVEPLVTVERGLTGTLISLPTSFSVFGESEGRREQMMLGSHRENERSCIFSPGRFSTIIVTNGTYHRNITQSLVLTYHEAHSTDGQFFNFSSKKWSDETTLSRNITVSKFEEMARKFHLGPFGTSHSLELILFGVLAIFVIGTVILLVGIWKGFIKVKIGNQLDGAVDMGQQQLPMQALVGFANALRGNREPLA